MEAFLQINRIFRYTRTRALPLVLTVPLLFLCTSFFPYERPVPSPPPEPCVGVHSFYGYSFLNPDIINKNAAYAPFFIKWDTYYERVFFKKDILREENVEEWKQRFCDQPDTADIAYVVYKSGFGELANLREAAADKQKKTPLPYSMAGNTFAEMIALNGCTEVIDYLMFAKKCEPYVTATGRDWTLQVRDTEAMQTLIEEGLNRFKNTDSHFVRLRYAYQIVRLAHYARQWQQTVDLYNFLMPKVDRKKPSIVFFWTLGHLAGALRQLGKYPEAAYRYSMVFRHCPSKRTAAYRSFLIRNDQDWNATLRLCQSDAEKSTLYILRAGGSHAFAVEDMQTIYELDPENPQLDLLLLSEVQELEKVFLRTRVTDNKYGNAKGLIKRQDAAKRLLDLQNFVRRVLRDKQTPNPKLWRCISGYLELLANDRYAAEKTFDRAEDLLNKRENYDQNLYQQLETWRVVLAIMALDPASAFPDDEAFRIRSYDAFKTNPRFEPFLQDWLSAAYAASNHPGKALLAAYEPSALGYNPRLDVLDDLLKATAERNPIFLEKMMRIDTNPDHIRAQLLEMKGVYLFGIGQPEAALSTFRGITPKEDTLMPKFSPFRELFGEKINRPVTDTLLLNRRQIVEKILEYEFRAKAASAVNGEEAAWYYYLIGLAYYNMSYFGYEWEAMDFYRSGYNWLRLPQGPEFPLPGSPHGNKENTDVSIALSYFERAMQESDYPEFAARTAFMAARCQQKQWFCTPECRYKPGSKLIPVLPEKYMVYYELLRTQYGGTTFYSEIIKECKWFGAYVR